MSAGRSPRLGRDDDNLTEVSHGWKFGLGFTRLASPLGPLVEVALAGNAETTGNARVIPRNTFADVGGDEFLVLVTDRM